MPSFTFDLGSQVQPWMFQQIEIERGGIDMAFKTTHNKDESLPQFMKSPQLIFSHKNS